MEEKRREIIKNGLIPEELKIQMESKKYYW